MNGYSAQMIQEAIQTKQPTSFRALWAALGNTSKPGGHASKMITAAMPNVMEELAKVKERVASLAKSAPAPQVPAAVKVPEAVKVPKAVKAPKAKTVKAPKAKVAKAPKAEKQVKSPWLLKYEAKEAGNPHTRKGSLYAAVWDLVKRNPGKTEAFVVGNLTRLSGKTETNVGTAFDVVIDSATAHTASRKAAGLKDRQNHRSQLKGYTVTVAKNAKGVLVYSID